jgi:hypothetical protein
MVKLELDISEVEFFEELDVFCFLLVSLLLLSNDGDLLVLVVLFPLIDAEGGEGKEDGAGRTVGSEGGGVWRIGVIRVGVGRVEGGEVCLCAAILCWFQVLKCCSLDNNSLYSANKALLVASLLPLVLAC